MKAVADVRSKWLCVLIFLGLVVLCEAMRKPKFKDVSKRAGLLKLEGKKYWSATVADLNRNGRMDLILSDHDTRAVTVYEAVGKEKFKLMEDNPLRQADYHGTAAADLTNNGFLDFIATKGGGRGKNPGLPFLVETTADEEGEHFKKTTGEDRNLGQQRMRGRTCRIFDINHDGLLDIVYINAKPIDGGTIIHFVYRNLGNGKFRVIRNVGFEQVNSKWATLLDVNNDGNLDLLFEGTAFELWLGTGRFKFKQATDWFPEDLKYRNVAGAVEFDFNRDGKMDLYLARGYRSGKDEENDYLLLNTGTNFVDVSREVNVPLGGISMHATDGDFNNDGFTDLYISQGGWDGKGNKDWILMNKRGVKFEMVKHHAAWKRGKDQRGHIAHSFDYNLDGRVDLIVGTELGAWKLYKNRSPFAKRHWLLVRVGSSWKKNLPALGALVRVQCGKVNFVQRVGSRGESHSQSYLDTLHFGLGKACRKGKIDMVQIKYIGGIKTGKKKLRTKRLAKFGRYLWNDARDLYKK